MSTTESEREILELEHAYWDAMQRLDVDTAIDLTADVSIIVGAQGHSAIHKESFRKMMNGEHWKLLNYEFLGDPSVKFLSPDIAAIAYKVREELQVGGQKFTLEVADSSVWQRIGGKWKCTLHTESLLGDPFGRDRVTSQAAAKKDSGIAQHAAIANLPVKDLKRARAFYEQTIGLSPIEQQGEELVVYKSGGSTVNVYHSKYAGSNQATAVTWAVGDIEKTVKDLKAKGLTFEHYDMPGLKAEGDIYTAPGMKAAWFKDPDGNILNVVGQ